MENETKKQVAIFLRDLIFETKIKSTAQALGVAATSVRSITDLTKLLAAGNVGLVLVDLNSAGSDAIPAVQESGKSPGVRTVAFVSHVDAELAAKASDAGADEVMPRSRFTTQLPTLLAQLSNPNP